MKALQLIVFGFLLYGITRKKSTAQFAETITPIGGGNSATGTSSGGSGGSGTGSGGGGVVSPRGFTFQFSQPSNTNNLYSVHLCSHARVCTQVDQTPVEAITLLEYWIKDTNNNTVVYCKDEIGGHHPNFFDSGQMANASNELRAKIETLKSSFVSNPPFYSYQDRTNNHYATFNKELPAGAYKWIVKNNGNRTLNLFAGYEYSEHENAQVDNFSLGAGSMEEFNLNIVPCPNLEHQNSPFKINANNNP